MSHPVSSVYALFVQKKMGPMLSLCLGGLVWLPCSLADAGVLIGPSECQACHEDEYRVWEKSKHASSEDFYAREAGKKIAQAMQLSAVDEQDNVCWSCHYTVLDDDGEALPEAGPSCESCHAPASDWLVVHSCYGGTSRAHCEQLSEAETDIKAAAETAEHKIWRQTERVKWGMFPLDNVYKVVENCFKCHTIAQEDVVNTGGHDVEHDFELVTWLQGEIRHHFLRSPKNPPNTPAQKRVLYMVGQMVDLEYSLRALASAKSDGVFSQAMIHSTQSALSKLAQINRLHATVQMSHILKIYNGIVLAPNQATALLEVADAVSVQAQAFGKLYRGKGADFAEIDALIPTKTKGHALH